MLLRQLFEAIDRTGEGNTAVVGWGRGMGHKGHMMLASSVITHAEQLGGDPYFVVSRTYGPDDPLQPEEKLAIYRKVFPKKGHIFQTATDELPDLTRVLTNLNGQGYKNAVVVVGADQKTAFQYLNAYNGKPNKKGEIPFSFDSLDVISRQETNDPSREEEGPRATPMRAVLTDPSKSEEEQFAVWRDAMSPELSDEEVMDLMQKAKTRMGQMAAEKPAKKAKKAVAEGKITLSTDPNWYGATVDNYQATGPVVNIPANQLVGFEPDDKMNQPKSQANVKKIVAGLKKGDKLPPLLVRKYKDGYQVLDGHHRFWAYKLLDTKSIPAQIVPAKDIEEISKQGAAEGSQEINWVKPNFDFEWHEVEEQSRMKQVPVDVRQYYQKHFPNKDAWLKAVQNGKAVVVPPDHAYEIRNAPFDKASLQKVLAPTGHEGPIGPAKEKRVNDLFDKGQVEMPIILKTSQGLWLIGGKTRLGTANYVKGLPAKVWLISGEQGVAEASLDEGPSLPSTLKSIATNGEPITQLYGKLQAMAKRWVDNNGSLKGFHRNAAGQSAQWFNNFYFNKLQADLYALAKQAPRHAAPLIVFLKDASEDRESRINFTEISRSLPPILFRMGKKIDDDSLARFAASWDSRRKEYESYLADLEDQADSEDDYDEPVVKPEKSKMPGQQNAQAEQIVNDILSKLPKNVAGDIRNAIARAPNKLQALHQELTKRKIQSVAEGWFFSSPEEKEEKRKQKKIKYEKKVNTIITQSIPELIDDINYNQFKDVQHRWEGISYDVILSYGPDGPDIVGDPTYAELYAVDRRLTKILWNSQKFSDTATNQQMLLDKEYIIKLLNQYLILLKKYLDNTKQGAADRYKKELDPAPSSRPKAKLVKDRTGFAIIAPNGQQFGGFSNQKTATDWIAKPENYKMIMGNASSNS